MRDKLGDLCTKLLEEGAIRRAIIALPAYAQKSFPGSLLDSTEMINLANRLARVSYHILFDSPQAVSDRGGQFRARPRELVFEAYSMFLRKQCYYCRETSTELTADHKKPRSQCGAGEAFLLGNSSKPLLETLNEYDKTNPSCKSCNSTRRVQPINTNGWSFGGRRSRILID
jgi:hypothetical protein